MASEKEEIVLDIKVEQGDAISELEKLKKVILQNKEEQLKLLKAYKNGKITFNEYVKESVRVENALKSQQNRYNEAQKKVTGYKSKIDELIKSNQKLSETVKHVGDNLNVAGVNIGSLSSKLTALANPVTAITAGVGALATAYATSTTGARDLAFASDQVSFVFGKVSEDIGKLIGGEDGGGGKGALSQLTDKYLELVQFVPIIKSIDLVTGNAVSDYIEGLRKGADESAKALERLRDIEISLAVARGFQKQDERNAENNRRIRDDEEQSLQERLSASDRINKAFESIETRTTAVLKSQIAAIKESTIGYENNRAAQVEVAKIEAEILDLQEMVNGKLTENIRARKQIIEIERKQRESDALKTISKVPALRNRKEDAKSLESTDSEKQALERAKYFHNAEVALAQQAAVRKAQIARQTTEYQKAQYEQQLQAASTLFGALSGLLNAGSEEQKSAAILQIAVNSGIGVSEAVKAGAGLVWPENLFAIASGIASVLSGIAQARSLLGDYYDGGYTGPGGKYDARGIVHAGEVVFNQEDVKAMGGPGVVDAMRPTYKRRSSRSNQYYDGGIVAKQATNEMNQQLFMANMIKSLPTPVLDLAETARGLKKLGSKVKYSQR